MTGRLIGVVGPSGVGKDTVMAGLVARNPGFALVRRVITRAPGLGGEDYDPVSDAEFAALKTKGAFCIDWQAHGLSYGIPKTIHDELEKGQDLLVNLSRSVLAEVGAKVPGFVVLNITASPEVLAARLAERGRETPEEIAKRLGRDASKLPTHLQIITIANDGAIAETCAAALAQLEAIKA